MVPFVSKDEVRQALPYSVLIPSLRAMFKQDVVSPVRHAHSLSAVSNSTLLLMPAWQAHGSTGVKLVTVAPHNTQHPTVHAIYILLDTESGVPLALMDGEELTIRRTAATSALASSFISREDSQHLLIVGNGGLAPHLAVAHCHTRTIKKVTIWGRKKEKSEHCRAAILTHPEFPTQTQVDISDQLEASCSDADIISCATTSTEPIVLGDWVRAGTHLDLVGGFTPMMREVDDHLMAKATVFVDTFAGALTEAGDIVQCLNNGVLTRDAIVAELAMLCRTEHSGRQTAKEISIFKSVGAALEDLCAANLVWRALNNRVD
ncbi:ornithine cyclodeaminase family protein [Undibacterium sp. SXout20W]|uniref:ornithine cyclodeaminase family protein n=1 Tax=Undibacterium sp. SXout20W TaxID=3413051 RepID=UPI003BF0A9A6